MSISLFLFFFVSKLSIFFLLLSFLMTFNRYKYFPIGYSHSWHIYIRNTFIKTIKEKYTNYLDLVIKLKKAKWHREKRLPLLGWSFFWFHPTFTFPLKGSFKSGRSSSPMRSIFCDINLLSIHTHTILLWSY